ncbi:MAG: signal peptidase I [Clostridiales bacterium]|nr:signal peptidase I [Candidatus Equinaster intestinalis]
MNTGDFDNRNDEIESTEIDEIFSKLFTDDLGENEEPTDKKSRFKNDFFEWIEIVVSAIVMLVILFTFVFKVVVVDGNSMKNTLLDGQRLIISNFAYEPNYGDIVVISKDANHIPSTDGEHSIIKRVIATEGQVVNIDFQRGIVYVDGVALDEPYVRTLTNVSFDVAFPAVVKEGCVFVLGDNRNDSTDSRSSFIGEDGMVDKRYIVGKALFRIFPFNVAGGIY